MKRRWTLEEVSEFFKQRGFTLLSTAYNGCNDRLRYLCVCGREHTNIFRQFKFKNGIKCPQCTRDVVSRKVRETWSHPEIRTKQVDTFRRKYGTDNPLQNSEVKRRRETTNLQRYGVRSVSQVPDIANRQREGFIKKYGVSHFMKDPDLMRKYRQTLIDRYGVPSMAFLSGRSSKEAQRFFTLVFDSLPETLKDKCYFSPRTHEFNVWYKGEYFKYDFVQSRVKLCIEYNGSRFHPRPDQSDEETGWCLFRPTRTVKEAKDYEKRKYAALRNRGFDILTIWDHEHKHSPDSTVRRCVEFLTQGSHENSTPSFPVPSFS